MREASRERHLLKDVSCVIFDAYEVSWRARTEDLLYNALALFRPESGFPDQKDSAFIFKYKSILTYPV